MTGSYRGALGSRVAVMAIALTVLVCWVLTFRGHGHDWGGDFSLYIAHARNIAEGHSYGDVNYITEGKHIPPQSPPTYPPLFPALLSPAIALFGMDYGPMRAFVQTMWLLAGVLLYVYGRRRGLTAVASAVAVGVFLLSSMVLSVKDSILSESTYVAVATAALIFIESLYREDHPRSPSLADGCIAGLLLLAACLTRVTGVALVGAFAFHELYRTRRIRPFAVAAGATFITGFALYRLTLYDGTGYSTQFGFTPQIWAQNAVHYVKTPASLWAALPAVLRYPAALLTLGLAGVGLLRRFLDKPTIGEFYVVLYMVPLLLFSYGSNVRYITPVYPLLLMYCAESLHWTASRMREDLRRAAFAALALFLIVGAAANFAAADSAPEPDGPEVAAFQEAVHWIRNNVPPDEVVVSWNPRVVALYTGRRSAFYPPVADAGKIEAGLEDVKAKWVLTFARSEPDVQWLLPYTTRHADRLTRVWRNEAFAVYRVRRPSEQ